MPGIIILFIIYYLLLILNPIICTVNYLKKKEPWRGMLALYLICMLFIQLIANYYTSRDIENIIIAHIFHHCHFVMIGLVQSIIVRDRVLSKWIRIIVFSITAFFISYYILLPDRLFQHDQIEIFVHHYCIILFALIYIYKNLEGKQEFKILNIGILCYSFMYIATTLFFRFINDEIFNEAFFTWLIYTVNTIVYHILILIQLIISIRKKA